MSQPLCDWLGAGYPHEAWASLTWRRTGCYDDEKLRPLATQNVCETHFGDMLAVIEKMAYEGQVDIRSPQERESING